MNSTLGIDEVGRGAWAGPLVVGACVLGDAKIEGLTDSKILTKKQREQLSAEILASSAIVGLGWVSSSEIDEIGLSSALKLATRRAVEKVQAKCREKNIKFDQIIIDGTIDFLESTPLEKYTTTLKKADFLISSVSAAAIVAKVARDNFMKNLAEEPEFSVYGFEFHSGYGTVKHRAALAEFGASRIHRQSFKPISEFRKNYSSAKTTKQIGDEAEEKVAKILEDDLHEIIARNWRTRWCEVDIVSKKGETFYFTEVKFRKNADFGGGVAAVSEKKIKQMRFAAEFFATENSLHSKDLRLMAAIVEGEDFEIKDIFEVD